MFVFDVRRTALHAAPINGFFQLERMAIAAKSVGAGLVEKSFPTGTRDPEKLLRKR